MSVLDSAYSQHLIELLAVLRFAHGSPMLMHNSWFSDAHELLMILCSYFSNAHGLHMVLMVLKCQWFACASRTMNCSWLTDAHDLQ